MDHEIDKQDPRSTEGGQVNYEAGDKVWVKCKVIEPCESLVKVTPSGNDNWFWVAWEQCRPVEPSSKEPTQGQKLAERTMKAIWAANDSVSETPVVEACTKTANDQLLQSLKDYPFGEPSNCPEIPDSSSKPLAVGDAVRFVLPGHTRHGTKGIVLSIVRGPSRQYRFESNCGQFHRYCTIAELEHYDQADPIDIKGSMQSLDGADTIQAGDLQWADRDGKYRLCNFTIGMRVHEAIQRGKAHGEKWVFYRKFREVGE
jgi:hypothetical protein